MIKTELQKAWDKTVTQVFLSKKNAGFLSSILTSLSIHWFDDEDSLAYVTGTELHIHKDRFLELNKNARLFVVLHELWHIARLHEIRQENRDMVSWNKACDYVINNDLIKLGYNQGNLEGLLINSSFRNLSEEEIYKTIVKFKSDEDEFKNKGIGQDLKKNLNQNNKASEGKLINTILKASQQSKTCGEDSSGIESILNKFLKPVINWRALLENYLKEINEDSTLTWSRPNRRFQDIYLPGKVKDTNKLANLMFFLDTSGSISEEVVKRFVSEVKYIHEEFKPELLTVIQFDYRIQSREVFTPDDTFSNITIKGYGGTSLGEVRECIIKERPTAAVIFSDLYVEPMEKLPLKIPIIWVCVNNPGITNKDVPCGTVIHLNTSEN